MSIFNSILGKIFPSSAASKPSASTSASATPSSPPASRPQVDLDALLTGLARKKKEKLNWRSSIVDLMKTLDLDSSLEARKALAKELHYTGNTSDTAAMNIWLHSQVLLKLQENGGVLPPDMRKTA